MGWIFAHENGPVVKPGPGRQMIGPDRGFLAMLPSVAGGRAVENLAPFDGIRRNLSSSLQLNREGKAPPRRPDE